MTEAAEMFLVWLRGKRDGYRNAEANDRPLGENELFAKWLLRAKEYAVIGRAMEDEEARLSIAEADGSSTVYFFSESGMGAIKIGVTANVHKRLSTMRPNTPHEVTVLGRVHADGQLEAYLKNLFYRARIRGEWFHPVPDLLECIERLPPYDEARCVVSSE